MSAVALAAAAPVPPIDLAEAQLRAINHRFVNAFAVGDRTFMARLVEQDFVRLDARGEWMDRAQHLDSVDASRLVGRVSYDAVDVRLFGDVAVVGAVFEAMGSDGRPRRARYTDVYRWDGSEWRLVSGQNTRMSAAVRNAVIRGETRPPGASQGNAGKNGDEARLRELAMRQARAMHEGDRPWHEAHLAPGYIGVEADGAARDRAATLAALAARLAEDRARYRESGNMRIRRFGAIGLVHSGYAVETAEGRRDERRYTSIWHKRMDGVWSCVSMHVTPVQASAGSG